MALTIEQLNSAFEANHGEAAGALKRACDVDAQFVGNAPTEWSVDKLHELSQPGVIMICKGTDETALICIPKTSSLVPDWYTAPDPTQNGRLQGLALEFGSLILPEDMEAFDCSAIAVSNISKAIERGGLPDGLVAAQYTLQAGDETSTLVVTCPCPNPTEVGNESATEESGESSNEETTAESAPEESAGEGTAESTETDGSDSQADVETPESSPVAAEQSIEDVISQLNAAIDDAPEPATPATPPEASSTSGTAASTAATAATPNKPEANENLTIAQALRKTLPSDPDAALRLLPTYTKSLLKIEVPLAVTLASTKQSVKQILEMSPGTIIKFDKPCDSPLKIEVRNSEVAEGEVVKVGEKFGIRITAVLSPPERFNGIRTRTRNNPSDSK